MNSWEARVYSDVRFFYWVHSEVRYYFWVYNDVRFLRHNDVSYMRHNDTAPRNILLRQKKLSYFSCCMILFSQSISINKIHLRQYCTYLSQGKNKHVRHFVICFLQCKYYNSSLNLVSDLMFIPRTIVIPELLPRLEYFDISSEFFGNFTLA